MCKENKELFIILFAFLFLSCLVGVLRAEEPGPWFLISETELRSIGEYLAKSEQEKQSWQSQASELRIRAEKSEADSSLLNNQLAEARAQSRKLETSFNEYEADQLIQTSLKNGEIAKLKEEVATEKQKATKAEGTAALRLVIIIALASVIVLYIAFKVCRFFRLI